MRTQIHYIEITTKANASASEQQEVLARYLSRTLGNEEGKTIGDTDGGDPVRLTSYEFQQ
jgi:hypothetical protein